MAPYYAYTAAIYSEYYNYIPAYYRYTAAYYYYTSTVSTTTGSVTWQHYHLAFPMGINLYVIKKTSMSSDYAYYYAGSFKVYLAAGQRQPSGSMWQYNFGTISWNSYSFTGYITIREEYYRYRYYYDATYYIIEPTSFMITYPYASNTQQYIRAYYAYTAPKYYYNSVITRVAYYAYTPPIYEYTAGIETNPIHYIYTEV